MGTIRPRAFIELFTILWRRKLVIILVTGVVLAAAWPVIGWLPGLYESRATVMVSNPPREDAQVALQTQVANVTQQLTSRPRLESLLQRHQLKSGAESDEAAVERLRKEIKVTTQLRSYYPNAPESVSLAWRHADSQLAQAVVADLVAGLSEISESLKKDAVVEAERLETEMTEAKGQLRRLGRQRVAVAAPRNSPDERPMSRAAVVSAVETLSDKQYALERQVAEQQRQINEQQKLVAEKEKLAKSAPARGNGNGSYGTLLARKAELEGQLNEYAAQYTDKHPKVIQARSQLSGINRQLAALENGNEAIQSPAATPEAAELRTMQRELIRLQTELDVTRRDLDRKKEMLTGLPNDKPANEAGAANLAQAGGEAATDYDLLMKHYSGLEEKQSALQLQSGIGWGGHSALFVVVDPPSLPHSPVAPNRKLLRLLALALALGLGLGLAAALEAKHLLFIHDERDVEYLLGVPVIGLIPETLTPVERALRRRMFITSRLLWVLLAAASVPVLVVLLTRLHIFQLIANR